MTIAVDYDQADWGSSRIYDDGVLPGLWVPDKVVIHWGGSTIPPVTKLGERRLARGWQRYHIGVKGWRDIAYNYATGNSGAKYRFRGWNPSGATSGDYEGDGIRENNEAVACVWLGGSGGDISHKAYEAMGILVSEILAVIGLDKDVVIGHREVKGNTTCPGTEWMDWIQAEGWIQEDEMNYRNILDRIGQEKVEELRLAGRWSGETAWYFDGRSDQVKGANQNLVEVLIASDQVASLDVLPTDLHDHDETYAIKSHPHTVI